MQKPFLKLSRDEQADVVRPLIADGGSYGSVAKRLRVKRGRIAGICRDYDIKTTHSAGCADLPKSDSGAVLRLAVIEARQCIADDGHRCAFEKQPGSDYCGLRQHQALEKKRRR